MKEKEREREVSVNKRGIERERRGEAEFVCESGKRWIEIERGRDRKADR